MQGHFCFIKCLIFEWLPEVDVSAICWIFGKACSCGPYHIALGGRALFSSSFFPQWANRSAYPGSDIAKLLQNKRSGVACTQTDYLVFGVRIESMRIFSPQLLTGFWGENRIYRDFLTPVYKGRLSSFWGENRIYGDISTPVYTQVSRVRIE